MVVTLATTRRERQWRRAMQHRIDGCFEYGDDPSIRSLLRSDGGPVFSGKSGRAQLAHISCDGVRPGAAWISMTTASDRYIERSRGAVELSKQWTVFG
jgi:hypothetical protein